MDLKKLLQILENHFGKKARHYSLDTELNQIKCVLYDSFVFKCQIDKRYGTFGGGIVLEDHESILINFFGKKLSLNSDELSIKSNLDIIDHYCRLRLPNKFIEMYNQSY